MLYRSFICNVFRDIRQLTLYALRTLAIFLAILAFSAMAPHTCSAANRCYTADKLLFKVKSCIVDNATKRCPSHSTTLCASLAEAAREALKQTEELNP